MNWLTGQLLFGEVISSAVAVYTAAGGGGAGWSAVREYLVREFRGIGSQQIDAIIGYAQRTVLVGQQYTSGGPGYAPNRADLPDARRAERAAGYGPNGEVVQTTGTTIFHEVRVDIIDPDSGDPWYTTAYTVRSSGILTREELQAMAEQHVAGMYGALATVPGATGRDPIDFNIRVRFRGAWIGYT